MANYRAKRIERSTSKGLPLILSLNSGGEPTGWITYERCAYYYAKDLVLWSLGKHKVVLRGGNNARTGKQSILEMDTIVAIDSNISPFKFRKSPVPPLTNKTLFERDRYTCAYCGSVLQWKKLTRDHILPKSKGGKDVWDNCVTCCAPCNQWKDNRTPEEADLQLLYVPYTPSYNEHLILQNRKILTDQMNYLMKGVSKNSRVYVENIGEVA
jgi:5-methylcytosine-specific restriction endonuclease McrA